MIQLGNGEGRALKSVEFHVAGARDLALVDDQDAVWVVVPIHYTRWWDIATLLWWWCCPADKKAVVKLHFGDRTVPVRAVRVATRHVRLRGLSP